jgi:hypothetical protein
MLIIWELTEVKMIEKEVIFIFKLENREVMM